MNTFESEDLLCQDQAEDQEEAASAAVAADRAAASAAVIVPVDLGADPDQAVSTDLIITIIISSPSSDSIDPIMDTVIAEVALED